MISQVAESLVKLEAEKHQVLVNAVVVNFVPVQIEDVQESLKPKSLSSLFANFS